MRYRFDLMTLRMCALGSLSVVMLACGGGAPNLGPVRPMPPGASWTGCWRTNFGPMKLFEDGEIKGAYTYNSKLGLLRNGVQDGNQLQFEWVETRDGSTADARGRARFAMSDDGRSFRGHWGTGSSESDGGTWTGTRTECKLGDKSPCAEGCPHYRFGRSLRGEVAARLNKPTRQASTGAS